MARELRWWLVGVLAACGALTAGYVPPHGVAAAGRSRERQPEPTPARRRAQVLADQWRWADVTLRLAEYRRQLGPELTGRRERDEPGPALLVDAPDTVPAYARQTLRTALDTVWRELGLGVTKVSIGVAVDLRTTHAPDTPKQNNGSPAYLLPDSTDRATCVVLIPGWYWTRSLLAVRPLTRNRQVEEWLRAGLGQCAFLAAYGAPGNVVRRWLARRYYDLARYPLWDRDSPAQPEQSVFIDPNTNGWWWPNVYRLPVPAIGCLAGRARSCRAAVLAGADDFSDDSLPRLFSRSDLWWWRNERLVGGGRYLADVAREVGHDRFARFWTTTEPVDTALAAALKLPVGEWTARWQRRSVPALRLGPTAPASSAALGILVAGLAVVAVALSAARRQVG